MNNHLQGYLYLAQGMGLGLIASGFFALCIALYPIVKLEVTYAFSNNEVQEFDSTYVEEISSQTESSFEEVLVSTTPPMSTEPVNTENSIVIEKIDVNVPIVWDTSVFDKQEYFDALSEGVAHAGGTQRPNNKKGNTYLFAHSTLNPLEIEKYAASFTLLHKLEEGDSITAFNNGIRYDYRVISKEVVDGFNTEPLTRTPDFPMLTLQTCDPPGVPIDRMIITAKLISVYK